jgi:hypothetical protein
VPPAGSIEIERRVERLEQRRVGSQANIAKLCDLYKQLATDVRSTLPVALPVAFVRSAAAWNGVQCNYGASLGTACHAVCRTLLRLAAIGSGCMHGIGRAD